MEVSLAEALLRRKELQAKVLILKILRILVSYNPLLI